MREQIYQTGGSVIFLVVCLGAQLTGSLLTIPGIRSGWYAALDKPFFNPPGWVFGPVWTALYFSMAVAAWEVWRRGSADPLVKPALLIFFTHLILGVLWSGLFFGLRRPGLAFLEIILLWFLILAMILVFYRIHRWTAWILLPYLAWVLFAAFLNGAIWWLNRGGPVSGGSGLVA